MNKDMLELLLKQNIEYLCEIYQFANQKYFTVYIDGDQEGMDYYKELFCAIANELRKRGYWSY